VILGFPCNQFGSQEPGENNEIEEFACSRFKVSFPMFNKVDVNGDNADPLYKFLTGAISTSTFLISHNRILWNFNKVFSF
jgi:glutathione peroxidase